MWLPLLDETINSNQKLLEYTEKKGELEAAIFKQVFNGILKNEVEMLLRKKEEGWLYKIKDLLNKEENKAVKIRDEELLILEQLCVCYDKEKILGKDSLLNQCDSLQQIKEVYQITVFYLTRIAIVMEEELYMDFPYFIKEWNLSVEYIMMVMDKCNFSNKLYIIQQLVKIMNVHGEEKYVEEILKHIMELGVKVV